MRSSKKPVSSQELTAEIERVEDELEAKRSARQELTGRRKSGLLDGDDALVDAVERDLAVNGREIERLELLGPALEERLVAANEREREAVIRRQCAAGEKISKALAREIKGRFTESMDYTLDFCFRLREGRKAIHAANVAAAGAGFASNIAEPEAISCAAKNGNTINIESMLELVDPRDCTKHRWTNGGPTLAVVLEQKSTA